MGDFFHTLNTLGQWAQTHPWQIPLAGLPVILLLVGWMHVRKTRYRQHESHGSAHWGTWRTAKRAGLDANHGVVAGYLDRHLLRHDGPHHVLLCGPTRSGKGVGHVLPTLLTWQGSVLCLDPKDGENAKATAAWRNTLGPVYRFTPYKVAEASINVLASIRVGSLHDVGDSLLIAESLLAPRYLGVKETSAGIHFNDWAKMLLSSVFLHLCYAGPNPSLPGAWTFLTTNGTMNQVLRLMSKTRHLPTGVHPAIVQQIQAVTNIASERELGSVWSTALRAVSVYVDPFVAASTEKNEVPIDAVQGGERPISLYLLAPNPATLASLYAVYRVILDVYGSRTAPIIKHRLLNVYDEAPAYGYCRAIENGSAYQAGYGQKMLFVAQDLGQIWRTYGKDTAIWGNMDVKIFHTPSNDETAKRLSDNMLDKSTRHTASTSGRPLDRQQVSWHAHSRPLMTPGEIMGLPPDEALVLVSGSPPLRVRKPNVWNDRAFKARRTYAARYTRRPVGTRPIGV